MDWTGPNASVVAGNALLDRRIGEDIQDIAKHVYQLAQGLRSVDGTDTGLTGFDMEFAFVEKRCLDPDRKKTFFAAEKRENGPKNRYVNVLPPDDTRVELQVISGVPGSDYVNANHILTDWQGCPKYIATQGPVSNTVNDFWRMVWEQDCRVIVMLTQEIESSRVKCVKYWPESQIILYDKIRVEPLDVDDSAEPVIRAFSVTNTLLPESEARIVTHFQYREWPDHGLPASPTGFLRLVQLVCKIDSGAPIVVHCSAGIGRTGTFCTVHSIICHMTNHFNFHGSLPPINIVRTVLNLRDQRPGMVQNKDQYMFCYLSILQESTRLQKLIPVNNVKLSASPTPSPSTTKTSSS